MNPLEDWLINFMEKPIATLNRRYRRESKVKKELELLTLPKTRGYTVGSSHVSDTVLIQLHAKIQNQSCEFAVWEAVLWYLAHPLPTSIAHELIDRDVAILSLGHTRQVDEVQWRLATLVEEALLTLVRERYTESHFSVAQLNTMLHQYQYIDHFDAILDMLKYRQPSSPEKEAVYVAEVKRRKRALRLKQTAMRKRSDA